MQRRQERLLENLEFTRACMQAPIRLDFRVVGVALLLGSVFMVVGVDFGVVQATSLGFVVGQLDRDCYCQSLLGHT